MSQAAQTQRQASRSDLGEIPDLESSPEVSEQVGLRVNWWVRLNGGFFGLAFGLDLIGSRLRRRRLGGLCLVGLCLGDDTNRTKEKNRSE
jgi:hypothetical protein